MPAPMFVYARRIFIKLLYVYSDLFVYFDDSIELVVQISRNDLGCRLVLRKYLNAERKNQNRYYFLNGVHFLTIVKFYFIFYRFVIE